MPVLEESVVVKQYGNGAEIKNGKNATYYYTEYVSPVGKLTIACNERSLVGLWLEGQKYFGDEILEEASRADDITILIQTKAWLNRYFAGQKPKISELSLEPQGSEFQQIVWKLLCEIPYGEITTYGELARKVAVQIGKQSMSAQAVGGAVGRNPISIIIPCHRVMGADGSLTGYAGGLDKKLSLLEVERRTK